ncbi:MAG: class I SAM-dependent methyltransferase, partial [Candidatus Diapherotrites archaeon]|nr:class I SAM-dependent methyltransferase [Candidatus Diapherotrites archaeon]
MGTFLHSAALVDFWSDFVDWEGRRSGENGFLVRTLSDNACHRILNAALGDGCDSIFLLHEGFEVVSNEVDDEFLRKALENARQEKVNLSVTRSDWRSLSRQAGENSFDAVLCLGNSLTYLFHKKDRLRALREFRKVLRPGGILLIDERNYSYILRERKSILNGNFRYSGKVVYCGKHVKGFPVSISARNVRM